MYMRYESGFGNINTGKSPTSQQCEATMRKSAEVAKSTENCEQNDATTLAFLDSVMKVVASGQCST